jgi:hypothetical protein
MFAVVDAADYKWLSQWKWSATTRRGGTSYAVRVDSNGTTIFMHRAILGLNAGDRRLSDHIDRNKLNNIRPNLRICNPAENGRNCGKHRNNRSGFKGVSWDRVSKRWQVHIRIGSGRSRKRIKLGNYSNPEAAHVAYCAAAKRFHGEFACVL